MSNIYGAVFFAPSSVDQSLRTAGAKMLQFDGNILFLVGDRVARRELMRGA